MFCTSDVFHNKIRDDSSEQVCERMCYKVVCDKVVTRGGRGGCGGGGAGYRIKNKNPIQRYGEKQILRVYIYIQYIYMSKRRKGSRKNPLDHMNVTSNCQ